MDTPSMSDRKDEAMSERITEVPEPSDAEAINRIAAYMKRNGYETCTIGTNGGVCYRRDNIYDALHAAEQARAEAEKRADLHLHQVLTCGVIARNPDPTLGDREPYSGKWNSHQADEVRALRRERDQLREQLSLAAQEKTGRIGMLTEQRDRLRKQLAEARRDCETATTLQEYTTSELEAARAEAVHYRGALKIMVEVFRPRSGSGPDAHVEHVAHNNARETLACHEPPSGDTQPESTRTGEAQVEQGACAAEGDRDEYGIRSQSNLDLASGLESFSPGYTLVHTDIVGLRESAKRIREQVTPTPPTQPDHIRDSTKMVDEAAIRREVLLEAKQEIGNFQMDCYIGPSVIRDRALNWIDSELRKLADEAEGGK